MDNAGIDANAIWLGVMDNEGTDVHTIWLEQVKGTAFQIFADAKVSSR